MSFHSENQAAERERLIAAIRHDVSERIRPVCQGWSEHEVDALIERIAQITYKYDTLQSDFLFERDPSDDELSDRERSDNERPDS